MATLFCGDCRELMRTAGPELAQVMVTDPPFGMNYRSCDDGKFGGKGVDGDDTPELRDFALAWCRQHSVPCLMFGTWKVQRPDPIDMLLTWEKGPHVGMGDLEMPWKPNTEEIYIIGSGFRGHRGSSVLRFNATSPNFKGPDGWRVHVTQKPVALMTALIEKCPPGTVFDPFMGSGTTGVSAVLDRRRFVGCETDPKYFDIAVRRIRTAESQGLLFGKEARDAI